MAIVPATRLVFKLYNHSIFLITNTYPRLSHIVITQPTDPLNSTQQLILILWGKCHISAAFKCIYGKKPKMSVVAPWPMLG